jgi:DedD protein
MTFTPPVVRPEPAPPEVNVADPPVADPVAAPAPPSAAGPGPEDSGSDSADPAAAEPPPVTGEQAAVDGAEMAAWIVQLGSFSSGDNARGLTRRLQEAGFPAYIDEVRIDTGVVYRVRVGPEIRKADAEATLDRLGKKLDLKGIVLRHP